MTINIPLNPILKFASIMDKLAKVFIKTGEPASPGRTINSKVSVLLADDDIDDREFFEDIIKEIHPGISFQSVTDGNELMKTLANDGPLPDLIFLDLNMPGKNGKECLKEIRLDVRLKHLPIIIYSTSSLPQDITDTYSVGANLYFRKPSSFNGALISLRKVLAMDFENMVSQPDIGSYTVFPDKL